MTNKFAHRRITSYLSRFGRFITGSLDKVYNPLKRIRGDKMPVFIRQRWLEYRIHTFPNDALRALLEVGTFSLVDIPYFNRSNIKFNITAYHKGWKLRDKKLAYEWVVCSRDEKKEYSKGDGLLITTPLYLYIWEWVNQRSCKNKTSINPWEI